jgi:hypothetical protein
MTFCTIIPASMKKHNSLYNFGWNTTKGPSWGPARIHYIIKDNNKEARVKTIDWARLTVKHAKKRWQTGDKINSRRITSFSNENLEDGIHFNSKLKDKCFSTANQVALSIISNSQNKTEDEPATETSDINTSQESIQHDSWDYKRVHKSHE